MPTNFMKTEFKLTFKASCTSRIRYISGSGRCSTYCIVRVFVSRLVNCCTESNTYKKMLMCVKDSKILSELFVL
jgi:hypothetical protein